MLRRSVRQKCLCRSTKLLTQYFYISLDLCSKDILSPRGVKILSVIGALEFWPSPESEVIREVCSVPLFPYLYSVRVEGADTNMEDSKGALGMTRTGGKPLNNSK